MKKIFILLVTIIAINACGPTIESSNEDWTKNQEAIKKLKTEYPVFATLIDKKLEAAKTIWKESEGISDEDKKLEKMVEANGLLSGGTIGNLRNMKSKISSLKEKKDKLQRMDFSSYKLESRTNDAVYSVKKAIDEANLVLDMTSDNYEIEAAAIKIDRAFTTLTDAYKEIDAVISLINTEKAKKQKIEDDKVKKENQVKEDQAKEEKAKADIKCSYCGSMNKYDASKCKSCGANLK